MDLYMLPEHSDSVRRQGCYKVLVSYEPDPRCTDSFVAYCPCLSLVSQGRSEDVALASLAAIIRVRLEDLGNPGYATPRRSQPEIFQAFDAGEKLFGLERDHPLNTIQDPAGTGVEVIVRRASDRSRELLEVA